ncbi:hypothetical protein N0V90_007805 [Kalmusia sp. IMI 367209]|nr:hypothetical protein N0V90_007805 [Kalmusia sp. IMI 367209]
MNCCRKSDRKSWTGLLLVTVLVFTRHSFAIPATFGARQANNIALASTTTLTNTPTPTVNTAATAVISQEEFEPGWVPGPTTRGTLNIIFTCVITLFLCVWTTVQVNIEPPQDNINNTLFRLIPPLENKWLGKLLAGRIVRKLGWSCVTIIVPEAALAIAAYERRAAYLLHEAIKDPKTEEGWDLTLCYYAVMGGFVIAEPVDSTSTPGAAPVNAPEPASSPDPEKAEITTKVDRAIARVKAGENQRRTLTPQGVYLVYKKAKLPEITAADVKDKNKASKLTKTIVFFQALWMILQVIARTAASLPVTLLELHTCLHTFCAVAMYATWWYKPVDIDLPTAVNFEDSALLGELSADYSEVKEDTKEMVDVKEATSPLGKHSAEIRYLTSRAGLGKLLYIDLFGDDLFKTRSYFKALGNGYGRLWRSRAKLWREAVAISLVGLVYGGVHLAAWRNRFPTEAEQMLWRVAAAITAVGWSGFVLSLWLGRQPLLRKMCGVLFGICVVPCLFVRVYLLVESFISLRMLPKKSYDINVWAELWPHAG